MPNRHRSRLKCPCAANAGVFDWKSAGRKMSVIHTVSRCFQTLYFMRRARKAFVQGRRLNLPGQMFYHLGRSMGWKLLRLGQPDARSLLVAPVSITRYFEFDFAWRALTQYSTPPRHCLDVSSPFLFSFFVARRFTQARVLIMNPDTRDLRRTRRLAGRLHWRGIDCFEAGVETLDRQDATYDAVWSISVIEHIAGGRGDDCDAVRRMWRVLRSGGRMILTVPTDQRAWDEYREDDPYGTQLKSDAGAGCFFQRFYDEPAVRARIIDVVGHEPERMEWFGEKTPGHFQAYVQRWRREGLQATVDDPIDTAKNYQSYSSFADMPGAGVCGLLFIKP